MTHGKNKEKSAVSGDTCVKEETGTEEEGTCRLPSTLFNLILQRHEGDTSGGQSHGEGVACFEGGHVYKGMFAMGLMEGPGVFTWAGGLKYELPNHQGEFVHNMPMGHGTYTWPNGSCYKGQVYNGVRHGAGTYEYATDGVSYTGTWIQGKRHGKGEVFYNQSESSWYKGDWVKNSREGFGVRCYPSGNIYSGEWRNNLRHGEGTMRWLQLGQEYTGTWQDGVQHGRGTHVWIMRRTDGFQYSQSNRYTGDFVQGQRNGRGKFYYADGAVYEGEWKNDKKHGKGKFTSKDGHAVEAEFVDDQMMTNKLNGNGADTPLCGSDSFVFGDTAPIVESLLDEIPEKKRITERKQVEFVVLRWDKELRSIYRFYWRLSHVGSSDNVFLLSRLQLWRLLKDCHIHRHGVTLTQIDRLFQEDSTAQIHSPFTLISLRRLLSCLVILAHHIYSKDMESQKYLLASCLSKLMTDDILPNAKNVKGLLFGQPGLSAAALKYMSRCWDVYQIQCRVHAAPRDEQSMTTRHLLWMFKRLCLLDNNLTTTRLITIISAESQEPNNLPSCLDLEITFLEFFEVLLGCAEVKCQRDSENQKESCSPSRTDAQSTEHSEDVKESQQDVHTEVCEEPQPAVHREEHRAEGTDMETRGTEDKYQTIHRFFKQFFFPAFNHYQRVTKYVEDDKLCQKLSRMFERPVN